MEYDVAESARLSIHRTIPFTASKCIATGQAGAVPKGSLTLGKTFVMTDALVEPTTLIFECEQHSYR